LTLNSNCQSCYYGKTTVKVSQTEKTKMVKIDTDDLISIKTSAELRNVSIATMSELVKRGRFTITEIDGVKFLKRAEVLKFENIKSKGGRPKKDESK